MQQVLTQRSVPFLASHQDLGEPQAFPPGYINRGWSDLHRATAPQSKLMSKAKEGSERPVSA